MINAYQKRFSVGVAVLLAAGAMIVHPALAQNSATVGANNVTNVTSDAMIVTQVKKALGDNPVTRGYDIKVQSRDGIVQLAGVVDSAAQKVTAETVVRGVGGVNEVDNTLGIIGEPATLGVAISDSDINKQVRTALLSDSRTRDRQISVKTSDRVVALGGFVSSERDKEVAEALAEGVAGVIKVQNELVVAKDH
ncbi:MAG: BON domain-containing protein [Steroidobacteraceae bacterium]